MEPGGEAARVPGAVCGAPPPPPSADQERVARPYLQAGSFFSRLEVLGEDRLTGLERVDATQRRNDAVSIVEIADGRELFSPPRMPYTRMLLGAVPDLAMSGRQRIPVKGEIPNPINPPPGCAFNPRCPLVFERCREQAPALIDGVACHAVNDPAAAVPA